MTEKIQITNEKDFLSFIKDQAMNNGNLSIRGVARCCGVSKTAIIDFGHWKSKKLGEILIDKGFQAGHLIENGFPPIAVWLTIEYFAYESKAKALMAKQLAKTFGAYGIKTLLEKLNDTPDIETRSNGLKELEQSIESAININNLLFKEIGVEQAIINSIAVEMVQEEIPQKAHLLQPARNLLNKSVVQDVPLTVTELGKHFGISAIAMNKLLVEKGFQIKNPNKRSKKEPNYLPIGHGHEFAVQTTSKGKGQDNSTYYQLRWNPSVLEAIR